MSTTVVVLEALGITCAAVGMALAQSPPQDLRAWWDRHDWLRRLMTARPDDSGESGPGGLTILPWTTPQVPSREEGPG